MDIFDQNRWDFSLYRTRPIYSGISYLEVLLCIRNGQTCSCSYFQRRYSISRADSKKLMTRLISDDMLIPQAHKTMFNFNKTKDKEVLETMFELYGYDDPQSIKELMNLLVSKRRSFGVSIIMKKLNQKGYIKNTGLLEKLVIVGILMSWEDEKLGRLYCTEKNNLKNFQSLLYKYKILH